jgi:mannose-6-phosphate isomerase
MALYPLTFVPRLLEKMWAGRKLESILGKPLPAGKNIGESWEIYDFPPGAVDKSADWLSAAVANGPLKGKTLHQIVLAHRRELLGDIPLESPHGQFPLLIKYLDARQDLSIQVHPDRRYAAAHPEAFLKSEAWYIVQSDADARIFKGLTPESTPEKFRQAIAQGHCERLLNSIPVKPGDCFYLPSGTVHAVGGGILAAEVQTPSDTTFRVYDFKRIDPSTGRERSLHVPQAMECIHFSDKPRDPPQHPAPGGPLVKCEYFELADVRTPDHAERPLPTGTPFIWMLLEGRLRIKVDEVAEPLAFARGDTILLPAAMSNPTLATDGPCHWLEVSFVR